MISQKDKDRIRILGIIILDILIISLPSYYIINPQLVNVVGYTLFTLMSLVLLAILLAIKTSDVYDTVLNTRKDKPNWWTLYDILTTILAAVTWESIGWESLSLLLITEKLILVIKWPEYFLPNGKD